MMADLSKRCYIYAFIEGDKITTGKLFAYDLLADVNDSTYKAMQWRFDDIMDLRFGERLKMWFNNENHEDSDGFIKRIA